MLTSYYYNENGFQPCLEGQKYQWLDLENPEPEELKELSDKLDLPYLFLADPLDPKERPRLDKEEQFLLIIIRLPFQKIENGKKIFTTIPLGLIIAPDYCLTVCSEPKAASDLINRGSRKHKHFNNLIVPFKSFIECSAEFIRHLELMEDQTDEAELTLSLSQHNEQIMTLLIIDKALINYTVALKSNRGIMEKLMEGHLIPLSEEGKDHLEHALTENQQAIFMADIFGQVLGSMSDAFGTIISNNLNKIMKFLTGVTIILMLPTLVVGAYGMNVVLPLAEHPKAFWVLAILCITLAAVVWLFFWRKKWI
jgi:magnesium transporter